MTALLEIMSTLDATQIESSVSLTSKGRKEKTRPDGLALLSCQASFLTLQTSLIFIQIQCPQFLQSRRNLPSGSWSKRY